LNPEPKSGLGKIIESCQLLDPSSRAKLIEESEQIETAYANAALEGSTKAPDATEEVECHYICFTKASGSALWLLDGDRDGPLESTETLGLDGNLLEGAGLALVQKFINDHISHDSSNVGIMALVQISTLDSMPLA
jgi:ubiquitin carboxyl-terminal hydrolase L3